MSSQDCYEDPIEMSPPRSLKSKSISDLANSLSKFVGNGEKMTDITLLCREERFPAHKLILAARSDVFAAMFQHAETEEARANEVRIEDTNPDTLSRFLR